MTTVESLAVELAEMVRDWLGCTSGSVTLCRDRQPRERDQWCGECQMREKADEIIVGHARRSASEAGR